MVTIKITRRQPSSNHQATTNKECKKEKNVKNERINTAKDDQEEALISKKKKTLKGKQLLQFNQFWETFDYKKGKAEAIDAWLDLGNISDSLLEKILAGARHAKQERPLLKKKNQTPKMAQGWLSGRRWEDQTESENFSDKDYRGTNTNAIGWLKAS